MTNLDFDLFSTLSTSEKDTLMLFCQERILQPWEVLFHEGELANVFYIVFEWDIVVYRTIGKDDEQYLWTVTPRGYLWEMALFDPLAKKVRMASARSTWISRILVMLDYAIENFAIKHPEILACIQKVIDERKTMNRKITWL